MSKEYQEQAYEVTCPEGHTFTKVLKIKEEKGKEEATAFCPECGKTVKFTIKGKIEPDEKVYRDFKL